MLRTIRYVLYACCAALGSTAGSALPAGPAGAVSPPWSVTPSPSRGSGDELGAVSCAGPAFCMAVGSYAGAAGTLAETWNGRSWSVTPSPSPGGNPDELFAVSCTSSSFCMAVGWHYDAPSASYRTLAEAWDGRSWSIVRTPSRSVQSVLFGVSCISSGRCAATGYFEGASGFRTLAESWNGATWSVVPSPGGGNGVLHGVSCARPSSCVAVGWHQGTSGSATLVESWNGNRWSVVSSPSPGSGNNELLGVSCTSAVSCAAVGFYSVGLGPDRTLAESWNGSRWSAVASPDRGTAPNTLEGVSCPAPSRCVAVGYNLTGAGYGQTLIESWAGSAWSVTPSPSPGQDSELLGASCAGPTSCEAVGYDGSGSLVSDRTLVETRA